MSDLHRFAVAFGLLFLLSGCYLTKQGRYLVSHRLQARGIDKILREGSVAKDVREALALVRDIKRFAVDVLSLQDNRNFTRYLEIEKEYLVDVVSASAKDRFEVYEWRYPLFGSFPYKGFYEREDAVKEAEALRRKGLDVAVRRVDAFSTLGFFADPIYSFMKDYSVFEIASLIIHEQTHATVFIRNSIQFNEEMATFVGWEGAFGFIEDRYGVDSEPYRKAKTLLTDIRTATRILRELHDELHLLYSRNLDRETKIELRQEVFERFKIRVAADYDDLFLTDRFERLKQATLNNAHLLSYARYTDDLELFYELLDRRGGNLAATIGLLVGLADAAGDPKENLRQLLGE